MILTENGEPFEPRNNTLALGLAYFRFEAEQYLKNYEKIQGALRLSALRKSCGVKNEGVWSVNLPPRYKHK